MDEALIICDWLMPRVSEGELSKSWLYRVYRIDGAAASVFYQPQLKKFEVYSIDGDFLIGGDHDGE
jgi:hypothetical protein